MSKDILKFFSIQRQLFGVCPCCGDIFRVSDTKVFIKQKPKLDWMDKLDASSRRIDNQEKKLSEAEEDIRAEARENGRKEAQKAIRKVDKIFRPNRLDPDDAKVMFHPIDYVVFNGMKQKQAIKNIVLLDREVKDRGLKSLQKSIEKTVETEKYEWITIHVTEDGEITYK